MDIGQLCEVTERIATKLGHVFEYDCYLKNLVRTPPGIYPHGLGQKRFFETDFELLKKISLQYCRKYKCTVNTETVNILHV